MQGTWLLVCLTAVAGAADLPFHQSAFHPGAADGWKTWSPRPEIAPRTFIDGSLAISGNSNAAAYGGWERSFPAEPGKWVRLDASYRAERLTYERGQVIARLDWRTSDGKRAGQPEYAYPMTADKPTLTAQAPAPADAAAVTVQLYLANAPQATVRWDDVSLRTVPAPPARPVTVVSLNLRPHDSVSAADSLRQFVELARKLAPPKTDLIVLPEGATVVGTREQPLGVAETVPGPSTAVLGALAREKNAYVVAGLYEREGVAAYNTAVLIDRKGNLAGKYRKVYLPREEYEDGLTPGMDYPVFETDFGKIGIMICWDLEYADPARGLALRGAELILLPIWGGSETLAKARAIENHVFLAASGYDYPTQIIDPNGEVIASAPERGRAAIAVIDLNRRYLDPWLGNMRARYLKELRLDVPVEARESR
jgi:predicted amidohydrolase